MKGGNHNKKVKPPNKNKIQDRSPLVENGETVPTNSNSVAHPDNDDKISNLQGLNNRLIKDIATLREERTALLKNEKEAQDALFESERRLNEEIEKKEDELRAVIEEKNSLESSIMQLREQSEVACRSFEAERAELLSKLREEALISLDAKVAEVENQVQEQLKEEFEKEIIKKENESQAAISEAKECIKVLKEDIAKKEDECQSMYLERKNLEANIFQLKGQMQAISEESRAAQLSWESEKGKFLSQVAAKVKDIEEMGRSHEVLQKAWEAEKEELLSALCKSEEKAADIMKKSEADVCRLNQKYEKMLIDYDSLKVQLMEANDMLAYIKDERQSQEALSAKRLEDLLIENRTLKQKTNELQHMVSAGNKQYSELNHQYQVSEKSLKQEIERLQTDTEHTRSLLEIQIGKGEELIAENTGLDYEIQELKKSLEEVQGTHSMVVEEKGLLMKEFESLHTEFTRKCSELDEKEIKMLNEREKYRKEIELLDKQKAFLASEKVFVVWRLEEVTRRSEEIQEKLLLSNRRVLDLEDQVSELHKKLATESSAHKSMMAELNKVKDNVNEQVIELSVENAQLKDENQQLGKSLAETIERYEEMQERNLSSGRVRVLCLEEQVSELFTELETARAAYDEVKAKLMTIEEDNKKQTNELREMTEEKEVLHRDLMSMIANTKKIEQDLVSANSSSKKLWETACIAEGRLVNLQSQLLAFAEEKEGQNFDFLVQLPVFAEALTTELSELRYQASSLTEEKKCLEEKNNSLLAQVAQITLSSGGKNQEGIEELESSLDNFNNDTKNRDIRAQILVPGQQHLGPAENKKRRKLHRVLSSLVASAGVLAVATFAAYFRFSK
ncbi:uncharacterized protein LOC131077156 [Cryptomeria japonica]|uniref:uncharacterized protein LOC131077156 n=1 Tax=Cryptomeria japonica TaxID=3369 RepID=UPI0027D9EB44|nr:uncharacterized protein LOC131077156 [Cryptomeria japonica]XP_057870573.2 uncharacterized protein LOC131077156 [Cryptomeria japonica]